MLNANINETNEAKIKIYKEISDELGRIKGVANKMIPKLLRDDFGRVWGSRGLGDIRERSLKNIAYLSNPQYCNSVSQDSDHSGVNAETRALCNINRETLESLFRRLSSIELEAELKNISNDNITPLEKLKEQFSGCLNSSFDEGEHAKSRRELRKHSVDLFTALSIISSK